jgi:hypothetical protein
VVRHIPEIKQKSFRALLWCNLIGWIVVQHQVSGIPADMTRTSLKTINHVHKNTAVG